MTPEEKQKIIRELWANQHFNRSELATIVEAFINAMPEESLCDLCKAPLDKQGNEYWRNQIAKRMIEKYEKENPRHAWGNRGAIGHIKYWLYQGGE